MATETRDADRRADQPKSQIYSTEVTFYAYINLSSVENQESVRRQSQSKSNKLEKSIEGKWEIVQQSQYREYPRRYNFEVRLPNYDDIIFYTAQGMCTLSSCYY